MLNDRVVLPRLRSVLDTLFTERALDTLALRFPELLRVRQEHFSTNLDNKQQRALFRTSVRYVEIETHSYCNRTCWFCPNSTIDRRTIRQYLAEDIYLGILEDLRSIGYRYTVSLSRYNEPFGDDVIFQRITQARSVLKSCHLQVNSNGDFLDAHTLERLSRLGMDELRIASYLPNDTTWTSDVAEASLSQAAMRLRLRCHHRRETGGHRISYEASRKKTRITLYCPNLAAYGVDRGGTVKGVPSCLPPRVSPCLSAVTRVYIDYDGHLMPCCQLRSDVPSHRSCALGRVDAKRGSIFETWGSPAAAQWRKVLVGYNTKRGPCRACHDCEWAAIRAIRALHRVALGFSEKRGLATSSRRDDTNGASRSKNMIRLKGENRLQHAGPGIRPVELDGFLGDVTAAPCETQHAIGGPCRDLVSKETSE